MKQTVASSTWRNLSSNYTLSHSTAPSWNVLCFWVAVNFQVLQKRGETRITNGSAENQAVEAFSHRFTVVEPLVAAIAKYAFFMLINCAKSQVVPMKSSTQTQKNMRLIGSDPD
ncbi:hypothetical protein J6590_047388 [Homalodisca vitripennis]|nr:hypothetical protein J6590_047388 [Homalodisca vitripennis]